MKEVLKCLTIENLYHITKVFRTIVMGKTKIFFAPSGFARKGG